MENPCRQSRRIIIGKILSHRKQMSVNRGHIIFYQIWSVFLSSFVDRTFILQISIYFIHVPKHRSFSAWISFFQGAVRCFQKTVLSIRKSFTSIVFTKDTFFVYFSFPVHVLRIVQKGRFFLRCVLYGSTGVNCLYRYFVTVNQQFPLRPLKNRSRFKIRHPRMPRIRIVCVLLIIIGL